MPSTLVKKPNFFQRAKQRINDFRKKHPYWFAFIVGLGVGLLAATALALMIFVPPLTPAFLTGGAAFAAQMGVLVIPTAIASFIGISAIMGGMFAAAKGIFNGLFGRKSLLVKATPSPGSRVGSTNTIKATVDGWNKTPPATPTTSPRPSYRSTTSGVSEKSSQPSTSVSGATKKDSSSSVTDEEPRMPDPSSGMMDRKVSSDSTLTSSSEGVSGVPVTPSFGGAHAASQEKASALTKKRSSSNSSFFPPPPTQPMPPTPKTPEQYYQEAAEAYAVMKAEILEHFNNAIKLANRIVALSQRGDSHETAIAFHHNNAKTQVLTKLKQMKVSFEKGDLTSPSLQSTRSEMKEFVPVAWQTLPEPRVFSEAARVQLAEIHGELEGVKKILSLPFYQKFVKSIADIDVIDGSVQGGKSRALAFKESKPAKYTLREIEKSEEKHRDVYRSIVEEDSERTSSIEEDRQARLEEVYRQFVPEAAAPLVRSRSRSFT